MSSSETGCKDTKNFLNMQILEHKKLSFLLFSSKMAKNDSKKSQKGTNLFFVHKKARVISSGNLIITLFYLLTYASII